MEFRIADTFTDSLARLTGDEQKSVKTTAFDLQLNPANPGMSFHKLAKAKDKRFWSVWVGSANPPPGAPGPGRTPPAPAEMALVVPMRSAGALRWAVA